MRGLSLILLLLACSYKSITAVYYNVNNSLADIVGSPGEPLFLTKYIEENRIREGKAKARVFHPALAERESYAGYITIDKRYNSNTFFWFFPSLRNPKTDSLVIWFIGGPGLTCLLTIFEHNGPFQLGPDLMLTTRKASLTTNHSVIYVDNPIGTGYSFTNDTRGYARGMGDVALDVLEFILQFYQIFPEYKQRDLYIGGDSYGGKFVISISYGIHVYNNKSQSPINLKGIMLGNGLIDFRRQTASSDYMYQVGVVDKKKRDEIKTLEILDVLGTDDVDKKFLTQISITGYTYFSNILFYRSPDFYVFEKWAHTPGFRRALHVGNMDFNSSSDIVRDYFENPFTHSVTTVLEKLLLNNYRVLFFSGQLDYLFPYTSSVELFETLKWPGAKDYKNAERKQWWLHGTLAGYVKSARNFMEVLVRNAGHVTFYEQPQWTCELITRFTDQKPVIDADRKARMFKMPKYFYF